MTIYQTIPGVVQTSIAGEYLLVAAKEAREHCPYVTEINESSAFLWRQLKTGCSLEGLLFAVSEEYEVGDIEEIRPVVEDFIREMLELGYIREIQNNSVN